MASPVIPGHGDAAQFAVVRCVGVNQIRQARVDASKLSCNSALYSFVASGRVPKGTPLSCKWGGKQFMPEFHQS